MYYYCNIKFTVISAAVGALLGAGFFALVMLGISLLPECSWITGELTTEVVALGGAFCAWIGVAIAK